MNTFEIILISAIGLLILFATILILQEPTIDSTNSFLSKTFCNSKNVLGLPLSVKETNNTNANLILIVKPHSTSYLCTVYTPKQIGTGIFHLSSEIWMNWNEPLAYRTDIVSVRSIPDKIDLSSNSKSIIIYEIKTKEGSQGVYHLVDSQICGSIPIIVDTNQHISSSVLQFTCDDNLFDFTITGFSNGILRYQ